MCLCVSFCHFRRVACFSEINNFLRNVPENMAVIYFQHPDYGYDFFGVPEYDVSVVEVDPIIFDEFTQVG